ncbi:uncharacterized protein TNCV_4774561 [Trichonephila clavipes]|uniref:DUF4371 domain-containing protein n=1 Tax=Trichonephila clavipes TaxID=2585209 RepID=A0A8X6R8F3_TRICX|nr:uncharacterized protein TNCV_4774561 [Trichonephila clavipes]
MKEAMLVAAHSLFGDFKNKTEILGAINMLQLSARTATRRIELIASNLEAKLANEVETCEFFSIQLDESTDAVDTAQLAISVKMVFDDFSTKEEFLKILALTARTQDKDIFSLFKEFAIENKLPLQKSSSITTDGARAMTESHFFPALVWEVAALSKLARPYKVKTRPDTCDCQYAGREASVEGIICDLGLVQYEFP